MKPLEFIDYVELFFRKYASEQRGLSINTISSYSEAVLQFFRFYEIKIGIKPEKLKFQDLSRNRVYEFCLWLETDQGCTVSTRNQRLTALHSLFRYILGETPLYSGLCRDILSIKMKKVQKKPPVYLSIEAIKALLQIPNTSKNNELRDLALLCLLYDSGIRVQELIQLKTGDLSLSEKGLVTVLGKGNKMRSLPLSPTTTKVVKTYIERNSRQNSMDTLFVNRSGNQLTRAGVSYILNKYVNKLRETFEGNLPTKISPHLMRHSKATHLLFEGINLIYIRDFLGHSSVVTTEIYASTNPDFLREAIEVSNKMLEDPEELPQKKKNELIEFLKQFRN